MVCADGRAIDRYLIIPELHLSRLSKNSEMPSELDWYAVFMEDTTKSKLGSGVHEADECVESQIEGSGIDR